MAGSLRWWGIVHPLRNLVNMGSIPMTGTSVSVCVAQLAGEPEIMDARVYA